MCASYNTTLHGNINFLPKYLELHKSLHHESLKKLYFKRSSAAFEAAHVQIAAAILSALKLKRAAAASFQTSNIKVSSQSESGYFITVASAVFFCSR
jgi:hypothetical protein